MDPLRWPTLSRALWCLRGANRGVEAWPAPGPLWPACHGYGQWDARGLGGGSALPDAQSGHRDQDDPRRVTPRAAALQWAVPRSGDHVARGRLPRLLPGRRASGGQGRLHQFDPLPRLRDA